MATIYIVEADNTQHPFPLPAEEGGIVTIGSNADCLIPMPGIEGLSGLHCSITLTGGEYVLKDEGSEGGTTEGERAISEEPLREGVPYGIGSAFLYFYADAPAEEPLAEPVPVSEYAEYAEYAEAPVAEEPAAAAEEPAAAAPVKKKKKKKAVSALGQAKKTMVIQQKKAQAMSAVNYVYVLLVLALAFYAGMTLRHWMVTGEYLPNFDSSPAKAAKK